MPAYLGQLDVIVCVYWRRTCPSKSSQV